MPRPIGTACAGTGEPLLGCLLVCFLFAWRAGCRLTCLATSASFSPAAGHTVLSLYSLSGVTPAVHSAVPSALGRPVMEAAHS